MTTQEDMASSNFFVRLRDIIEKKKIEKQALAKAAKVSGATITKYVQGKAQPSQETLARWALCFGFDLNWLLLGKEQEVRDELIVNSRLNENSVYIAALEREVATLRELSLSKDENIRLLKVLLEQQATGQRDDTIVKSHTNCHPLPR